MIIIMLGAQGTGKGTVAGLISEKTKWPQISTGDIFRKNISEKTELGIEADKYISQGNLVPDEITVPMVANRLKQEDIDYSVYGTPIESTTYKFAKCLQKRFGKIEGITDRMYITNSYHVPVFEEIDAFSKLKLESEFQRLSPGGAISYIETPNLQNNLEAVIEVIKYIYNNIMYAELNTKSDYCQKCGFDGEIQIDDNLEWYCPNCGNRDHSTLNVARRTCGYIGSNFWNKGRTQEIKERVLHIDNKDDE